MKKVLLSLVFVSYLTGCSSLLASTATDLITKDSPSFDTELVVGTKTQEMQNQVGDNAQKITKIQQIPWFFGVLLALGWFMPSPQEIGRGIIVLVRGRN